MAESRWGWSIYKTILIKYPEFKFGGSGADENLKVEAAKLVTTQAKDKGLQ